MKFPLQDGTLAEIEVSWLTTPTHLVSKFQLQILPRPPSPLVCLFWCVVGPIALVCIEGGSTIVTWQARCIYQGNPQCCNHKWSNSLLYTRTHTRQSHIIQLLLGSRNGPSTTHLFANQFRGKWKDGACRTGNNGRTNRGRRGITLTVLCIRFGTPA